MTAKLHQNGAVVELHAKHAAIICCNAWAPKILPELADIIMPERNQVMMTAPIGRSVFGCEGFCAENENLYGKSYPPMLRRILPTGCALCFTV